MFGHNTLDLDSYHKACREQYHTSGRAARDAAFRAKLRFGPCERRYLGWNGTLVRVLSAHASSNVSCLTGSQYIYVWEQLDSSYPPSECHEINFADDEDVLTLLPNWSNSEKLAKELTETLTFVI